MAMSSIYLDHAATTPMRPGVLEAMLPYLTDHFGNPSSLHAWGRKAKAAITEARDTIANLLGCQSKEIIFTSGGTESDNLALFGTATVPPGAKRHIITSAIEHHAVLHPMEQLERLGYRVTYLEVDASGRINLDQLEAALGPDTLLVSLMYGNNETGTLQPIDTVGRLAKAQGALVHVDAVQALGAIPIDLSSLPVDLVSFSAHKIGGPKGVGALYCSSRTPLFPLIHGGSQERKHRAGTENVAGIVGFAEALKQTMAELPGKRDWYEQLRGRMISGLQERLGNDQVVVNGPDHPHERLPHILNVSFPGIDTETLLMNLDLAGIAASSGSACTSGSLERSHVIEAMRLPEERASSAVRFSFGYTTTEEEIDEAVRIIAGIVSRMRSARAGHRSGWPKG